MSAKWRVRFEGVSPDMQPYPAPGIGFDQWFGDDEAAARTAYTTFEGRATLYQDVSLPPLGWKIEETK